MIKSFLLEWGGIIIYMCFYAGLFMALWDVVKNILRTLSFSSVLTSYKDLKLPSEKYLLPMLALMFSSFVYASGKIGKVLAFLISISLVFLLQMILFIGSNRLKRKASFEGELLVSELLKEYRMCDLNLNLAIEKVVSGDNDLKITKESLKILLYELRATGSQRLIKKSTEDFAKAIGTNWGKMLAHNIYIGTSKGNDISLALEDMLIQLREAKSSVEERKRLNSETVRMSFIMVPFLYFASLFMAVKFLDVPLYRLINNQFASGEGIIFFYLILFLFVGNIALLHSVLTQKLDY